MPVKRYTIAEKIKMCEKAIFAEKEGVSLNQSSKNLGIADVTLYQWVRRYRTGKLTGASSHNALVDAVKEDGNGLTEIDEPKQVKAIVSFDDHPDIVVNVDDPGLEKYSEQTAEIKNRVFEKCKIFTEL